MSGRRAWTPRPDPALRRPLPPGLQPHRHEPDCLYGWVFLQGRVWVDYWGNEHEIELMADDYVRNVVGFCDERPERILGIVSAEIASRALGHLIGLGETPLREFQAIEAVLVRIEDGVEDAAVVWLHGLPLLRALDDRLGHEGRRR